MALCGSIPKWLWSDRTIPRTATMDDVTSTAQIAICTPSNRSRMVNRRSGVDLDPGLDDLPGIGAEHRPYGRRAEEKPACDR
jgi:hypothetical protein